jgi:hypothetical protein
MVVKRNDATADTRRREGNKSRTVSRSVEEEKKRKRRERRLRAMS